MDECLIAGVMLQESAYRVRAVSPCGARGLMQLMPDMETEFGVTDPFDPRQNIMGGTQLLRQLLDRYHGKVELALAAFNAGPGSVDKYQGIPPYEETRNYVSRVLRNYEHFSRCRVLY